MSEASIQTNNKKINLDFKESQAATGRRKRSIARVWVKRVREKFLLTVKK